ncbi:Thermolabile hemolysin [Smittium mucronatum]|uniref:Thermolabile hemolysin n=1 Tax=Smittium mucronatum TaxID=133383 RepID=A0A1R0GZK2_9FUNG|nr:Thermolabile hemolysin [Smittium mucronatum]
MKSSEEHRKYLIVFGDSFSSVGNRGEQPKFLANWYTRFSNGPVWPEYLAHDGGFALIDFAVGGAVTNNKFIESQTGIKSQLADVLGQVSLYKSIFRGKFSPSSLQDDVVVIEIGTNDIFPVYERVFGGSVDLINYSNETVKSTISALESLIKFGYKNFVVTDTPNLSNMPVFGKLDQKALDSLDDYVRMTNKKLEIARAALETKYSSEVNYIRTVSFYDIYKTIPTMDLKKLLDTTAICDPNMPLGENAIYSKRSDSDSYFCVDGAHPSTRVHALLSSVFLETLRTGNVHISKEVIEKLVNDNEIRKVGSEDNRLYNENSLKTGNLNVEEYTIETTQLHVGKLVGRKDSHALHFKWHSASGQFHPHFEH